MRKVLGMVLAVAFVLSAASVIADEAKKDMPKADEAKIEESCKGLTGAQLDECKKKLETEKTAQKPVEKKQ